MADHEFFGTVSVSEPPTAPDQLARKNELDANALADRDRTNHTGTQGADTLTETATKKVLTDTERTKLSGVAAGATANATDAQLRDRATHTGTQSADTLTDGTTNAAFLLTERTKLSGVATGATANATNADLRDRATHTGTQVAATISDLADVIDVRLGLVVDGAPGALDTLNELAAAIADNPNFASDVTGLISGLDTRVDALEAGTGTGAYKANVGDGAATTFTLTHNLGTLDVDVIVRRASDGQRVFPVDKAATTNTATVDFGSTVPASNAYRVLIVPA